MKKNIKILIASCIAVAGVGASFGGAFALYRKGANDATFSIGTYTYSSTGTISYIVGDITSSLANNVKISPDNPIVTLEAPLSGTYSNDIPAQANVYGNLEVKAEIDAGLVNKVKWTVDVKGYTEGKYWAVTEDLNTLAKDATLGEATTTVNKDVAVAAAGGQKASIRLDFTALTAADMLTLGGKTFKVTISFDELSAGAEVPQIYSDVNAWSKESKEYRMVPNIEADEWEWQFNNVTYTGENDQGGLLLYYPRMVNEELKEYLIKGSDHGDIKLVKNQTYSVYYKGSTDNPTTVGEWEEIYDLAVNQDTHIIYSGTQSGGGDDPEPTPSEVAYYLIGTFNSWTKSDTNYVLAIGTKTATDEGNGVDAQKEGHNQYFIKNVQLSKDDEVKGFAVVDETDHYYPEGSGNGVFASEDGFYDIYFVAEGASEWGGATIYLALLSA